MKQVIKWATIATASLPLLSLAQSLTPQPRFGGQAAPPRRFEDILTVLDRFIAWFQAILFIVAIIFILVAAFYFVTARGNPAKVETARDMLIWAAVGIGVALLAFAIQPIVLQLLGGA